jgi:hypothetical protein
MIQGPCLEYCYHEYALYYIIIGIILGLFWSNLGSCSRNKKNRKFRVI